jgi:sugar phosphate isomerase/epimerase
MSDAICSRLPPVLKTSLAGYSFREYLDRPGQPGKMSLMDLADYSARLQIDAYEPTFYYFLKTDDAWIYALKRHILLAGLEISCTPNNNNFAKPVSEQGPEREKIRHSVDWAVKLGSPAIRVFAGSPVKGVEREQAFRNVVEGMKHVSEYAAERGIFLALENHGYLTEMADDVLRIVDAVKNEWLAVNLDSGNFRDNTYAEFAKLAPRAVTCQFKIQAHEGGQRVPADFNRLAKILREANYRGYVALEYEGADPFGEVPGYIEKLKAALKSA